MTKVVGVRFRNVGKIYYFSPKDYEIKTGDHVIVETARGIEYGKVVLAPREVGEEDVVHPLKEVLRVATKEDDEREAQNRVREREAFKICQKKIREHGLEMKLIDAEYTFDNNKVLFYFTADGRIDFRQLVKDLAAIFKTRIELGCPFILVTDPRSEGGAFYLRDSEFEQMITDYVTDKLDELGLTKDELVLSGASMGTFGSLYYGSKLSPHALLLAKPLANMGNVARNERILRAGGFATSLDILMKNYDNLSDEAIEQLNNRMWDRFDSADWSHTKFIISYLYEDDYDPDGYPSILSHLKSSGVEVYGKGSHGRHTDNSANVMAWFKSQYNNLLHDDFSR